MHMLITFCEYNTYICIKKVVEISNAFGVLVIHLAGRVRRIYIYICIYVYIYIFFSFTYFHSYAFPVNKSTCSKLFSKLTISKIGVCSVT